MMRIWSGSPDGLSAWYLTVRSPTSGWWYALVPVVRRSTLWFDHQDRNSTDRMDNSPTSADNFSSSGVASGIQAQHGDGVCGHLIPVHRHLWPSGRDDQQRRC